MDLPRVRVEWDDMSPAEQRDHRDECPDLCPTCEPYRVFGVCPSCGPNAEGNPDEQCLSCGWPLQMSTDLREEPEYWTDA